MPSKRYWAKNNPEKDYEETVNKTLFFCKEFKYEKFIHISSVSARCQLHTVYGTNKKKSEDIVNQYPNNLVLRLGPVYGKNLLKGVLIDMIKSNTVYIDGSSKYSFTDVAWVAEWMINNIEKYKGIKEIGSKDYIILSELAKKINSKSSFKGEVDDQLILDEEDYSSKSVDVYNFLKEIN